MKHHSKLGCFLWGKTKIEDQLRWPGWGCKLSNLLGPACAVQQPRKQQHKLEVFPAFAPICVAMPGFHGLLVPLPVSTSFQW